jgi:hypothetical protein
MIELKQPAAGNRGGLLLFWTRRLLSLLVNPGTRSPD